MHQLRGDKDTGKPGTSATAEASSRDSLLLGPPQPPTIRPWPQQQHHQQDHNNQLPAIQESNPVVKQIPYGGDNYPQRPCLGVSLSSMVPLSIAAALPIDPALATAGGRASPVLRPLMPRAPRMPDNNNPPTFVVGSQGPGGILPRIPGTPATLAAETTRNTKQIFLKNADGRYPCDYCTNTYANKRHLKRHRLNHTDEPSHLCPFCGGAFRRRDVLKYHVARCASRRGNPAGASHLSHPQGASTRGFPTTVVPQGTMGYQPPVEYRPWNSQWDSRQTQMLGVTSKPTNTTATLQAQTASSSAPQFYRQPGLDGHPPGSMAVIGGITKHTAAVAVEKEHSAAAALGGAYASYYSTLTGVFQNVRDGVLATASNSLLEASRWLLSHVVDLGLTSDNHVPDDERIKLWEDFNHAWLTMFQRQKEMMSAQNMQSGQTLILREGLVEMGDEVVRLCSKIEKHGLVDYQQGVWEERIMDILNECLDLYDASGQTGAVAKWGSPIGPGPQPWRRAKESHEP